jgi:hypothetical protein
MDLETAEDLQARIASESQKTAQLTGAEALRSQQRLAELERRAAYYKKGWSAALRRSVNDLLSEANDGQAKFSPVSNDRLESGVWRDFCASCFLQAGHARVRCRSAPAHGHQQRDLPGF